MKKYRDALSRITAAAFGKPGRSFASIPARPDEDADILLSKALDELEELRAGADRSVKALRLARSLTMGARSLLPASDILLPEETIEAKRLLADCERLLDTALSEPTP